MEEILEKIKNEINTIKEKQNELKNITEDSEKIKKEEEQLKEEQNAIGDTKSGFYKDLSEKIAEKHAEFIEVNNNRMDKDKEIEQLIQNKKEEIKNEIANKKQYIDENRNVNLEGVDLNELKAEKERLEREIKLNDTTKEEFAKMSDSEKREVRKAKEDCLNNMHRLNEITPIIELVVTLDGKTPKDKFIEIDQLGKTVEENFDKNNLDKILENKMFKDMDNKELLNEMVSGREKREQERYDETIQEAIENEEIKKKQEAEEEKELDIKEKIEKIEKIEKVKKEMEEANKDYKNIHFDTDRVIDKVTLNASRKNNFFNEVQKNKIVKITIDEKEGTIYSDTADGKKLKLFLKQALEEKKNRYNELNIKEKCREIAGGRIKGLLLSTKVNPAIVYALRNNPEVIETYIDCLQKQKELPFELYHDLRSSKLGAIDKLKMWVHAKAEDKIPGTRITFTERFWNKNKALDKGKEIEPTEKTKNKSRLIDIYKKENRDNRIEKNAIEKILRRQEKNRAKEIKTFMKNENSKAVEKDNEPEL